MTAPNRSKTAPPELEIEYIVRTRAVFGTRIHASGKSEETHDGDSWQALVQLSPVAMAELRTAVEQSGFFDLPDKIEPELAVRDGATLTWSIALGGRSHVVRARKGPEPLIDVLGQLAEVVGRVVGEELNRVADSAE